MNIEFINRVKSKRTKYSFDPQFIRSLEIEDISRAPIRTYAVIALFTIGTMGLSNAAVMRLNYPTHMMFKSCKLIPVMIGSILILGKNQFESI